MRNQISLFSSLLVIALLLAACGNQATGPASSGGSVEDYAGLVDALRAAGATVEPGDAVFQDFFTVDGRIIQVNGADVQVFEYETPEAMEAEAALVAPDGGSVGTSMVMWMDAPHFFKAGRILVLYVGDDAAVLGLLEGALGPQFAGR